MAWSNGLDLWGVLNQQTNSVDSLWKFPIKNAREKVGDELSKMQEMLPLVGLSEHVGKLIADENFKDENEEGMSHTLRQMQ
jgi:hypothetical protein